MSETLVVFSLFVLFCSERKLLGCREKLWAHKIVKGSGIEPRLFNFIFVLLNFFPVILLVRELDAEWHLCGFSIISNVSKVCTIPYFVQSTPPIKWDEIIFLSVKFKRHLLLWIQICSLSFTSISLFLINVSFHAVRNIFFHWLGSSTLSLLFQILGCVGYLTWHKTPAWVPLEWTAFITTKSGMSAFVSHDAGEWIWFVC